jgi:hypothetical protein
MGALSLPFLQMQYEWTELEPLKGVFELNEEPEFSWESWLEGTFQQQYDQYYEDHIGYRNFFVRLNNQKDYSLFSKANAGFVISGKDGVLFQEYYITNYLGEFFIGYDEHEEYIRKLKIVQHVLKKRGVNFLFVIAPGKASFFTEYIPDYYNLDEKKTNNYDVFSKLLIENNINHIDCSQLFRDMKDTASYPLFPKAGTHWSGYGTTLAADTIFSYLEYMTQPTQAERKEIKKLINSNPKLSKIDDTQIEKLYQPIDLVDFHSEKGELTSTDLRVTDDDIGKVLNLLWPIKHWDMYYPKVVFNDTNKNKPGVLIIGDSFAQSFYLFYPYYQTLFDMKRTNFWYYNRVIDWPNYKGRVVNKDLQKEYESVDYILFVCTEQNLNDPGFGFIDYAYNVYSKYYFGMETQVDSLIEEIKSQPKWYSDIIIKAIASNKTLDKQLRGDAIWMMDKYMKKNVSYIETEPRKLEFEVENNYGYTIEDENGKGYFIGKDALKHKPMFIQTVISLMPGKYRLTYKAKGFQMLETDICCPDDPELQYYNKVITDELKTYTWEFTLKQTYKQQCIRFFCDMVGKMTKDLYIYDVQLMKYDEEVYYTKKKN